MKQKLSFAHVRDELCDPLKLSLSLEMDVTVIAAHIATSGVYDDVANIERIISMFSRYPTLHTDIPSLTQLNKLGYLKTALQRGWLVERMIYGSDRPLQVFPLVSPWYDAGSLSFRQAKHVERLENKWDRDVTLKKYLSVPESVFGRSRELRLP